MMARNASVAKKPASLPSTQPEPTEAEQAEIRAFAKRKKTRRQASRFVVDRQDGGQVRVMPADVHADAAGARLMNALGITDLDLAGRLVMQIMNATHLQSTNEPVSAESLNAALAAVTGIAPRDEAEAMLAAQMVGVHWLTMDLLRKANDPALRNDAGNLAVKLLRTFPAQLEALKRYRSAGEQRVVVQHQHVNVAAEQAAVQVNGVGNPAPTGRGPALKAEERAHAPEAARSVAFEPDTPLPCPDPAGNAMPAAGSERESAVPHARRH
jgi:hypothetical protein